MSKKQKFESFDDSFEDETATAEAEKGGDNDSASDSDSSKEGEGEGEGDGSGDGGSGDGGSAKEGDDADGDKSGAGEGSEGSAGESSDGDSGKGEGAEGEAGEAGEGKDKDGEGEGADGDKANAGAKDGDGKDSEGKDEGGEGDAEGAAEGKDGEKGADGEKAKEGEGEGETDFFAADDKGADEGSGKEGETSYKPVVDELGIEYEGNDPKEIAEKVNERVEAAKQEVNLEDYNEQSRSLIKHLNENDGDVAEFLTNPTIGEMQGIINMEPEDKVRKIRVIEIQKEQNVDEAKAVEVYNEELNTLSVSDIRKMSDNIDKQAKEVRDNEVVKITGSREDKLKADRTAEDNRIIKERTILKDHILARDEFLGIKLTAEAKALIVKDLQSGKFDELVDKSPEASKFFAYMTTKYGSKIMDNFSKQKTDANREGYNKATDKQVGALHKSKASAAGDSGTGHQKGEEGSKKNFDTWQDENLFGEEK